MEKRKNYQNTFKRFPGDNKFITCLVSRIVVLKNNGIMVKTCLCQRMFTMSQAVTDIQHFYVFEKTKLSKNICI